MCMPLYSLLPNGWQNRFLFSLNSFLFPEISSFWGTSIAITPSETPEVLPTPVERKYLTGSSLLTPSPSMTLKHPPFSIDPLAVAPLLTSPLLPLLLNALFYLVYSSFLNLIPFSLPARPVSALDGLHSIKFCTFLSPFRMGLTNPGRALGRSCLLSISLKLWTLSGVRPFSTNSFRLASLLALLVGLNLSFLTGALLWFFKITKPAPFESVEVFRKDPFLALYFSLSLLLIFWPLCFLPSAALFTLMIWPFGPLPPRSPLRWRPHKELCFNWSAGLSTGVFLSIRANVRSCSSQWIPTKLASSPTSSYSALASVLIPLQLFWGSPSTAPFPFLSMYLR